MCSSWFFLTRKNCSIFLLPYIFIRLLYLLALFSFQSAIQAISFISLLTCMGLSGLEPPTSRLSGVRSNRLSYKPMSAASSISSASGGDKRDRTVDPLLAKQVLSQLSYTPVWSASAGSLSLFDILSVRLISSLSFLFFRTLKIKQHFRHAITLLERTSHSFLFSIERR